LLLNQHNGDDAAQGCVSCLKLNTPQTGVQQEWQQRKRRRDKKKQKERRENLTVGNKEINSQAGLRK